jgi:anti-sigma factor RsiW
MTNDCDVELLQRWFDGELLEQEHYDAGSHARDCAECNARVAWWKALRESANEAIQVRNNADADEGWSHLRPRLRKRRNLVHWGLPTALAAAAILLLVVSPINPFGRGDLYDTTSVSGVPAAITDAEARVAAEWEDFSASVRDAGSTAALAKADRHAAGVIRRLREDAAAIAALSLVGARCPGFY